MSSSKRSSSVPISFERFRFRPSRLVSPFHKVTCENHNKPKPMQKSKRKTQVHPTNVNLSESNQINVNASCSFESRQRTNTNNSLLNYEQEHWNSSQSLEQDQLPIRNTTRLFEQKTPSMVRYGNRSPPVVLKPRFIRRFKSFDDFNQ